MNFVKPTIGDWITFTIMIVIISLALDNYLAYRFRISQPPAALSVQRIVEPYPTRQEEKIFIEINEIRRSNQLPLLALDFTLMNNAKEYAKQLAENCDKLKHSNLDNYLDDQVAGLPVLKYGENLALHLTSLDSAMKQLKDSPAHYATMKGDYTHMGVAVLDSTPSQCYGAKYVVQHFAKAQ